jgi:hypothetical protein
MQNSTQDSAHMASDEWPSAEDWTHSLSEAARLMPQAETGGLRFEVSLPPRLATWVLESIARKDFLAPDEAVCVMLKEGQELSRHADLRQELLRRSIGEAMDDPAPSIPAEEVFERLKALREAPKPEPAIWNRRR